MPLMFMLLFIVPASIYLLFLILPWAWLIWVLGGIAFYGLFFTVSLYASMVALPHQITDSTLLVRYGALASVRISLVDIETAAISREWLGQSGDGLKMDLAENTACFSIGSATSMLLTLKRPVSPRRWGKDMPPVSRVFLHADDPEQMIKAVQARLAANTQPKT